MRAREGGSARREERARRDSPLAPARSPFPPSQPTVRAATLDDLQTVVELRVALLREHRENVVYKRLRADVRERAERLFAAQLLTPNEVTLLAERAGTAVGILRCVESVGSPLLYPSRYAYISSVYVVPRERRSGVLGVLLHEATGWCEERGLTEMRLHNASDNRLASAVWDALGFEVVEYLRVRPVARR